MSQTRRQFMSRLSMLGGALLVTSGDGAAVSAVTVASGISGLGLGPVRHAAFLLPGAGAGSAAAVYAQASRFLALHDGAGGIAHGTLQHDGASAQSARHLVLTLRMGDGSTATFSALPNRVAPVNCTLRFREASLEVSARGYRFLRDDAVPILRVGDAFSDVLLLCAGPARRDAALDAIFARALA